MFTRDHVGEPEVVKRGRDVEKPVPSDVQQRGSAARISLETGLDQVLEHRGDVFERRKIYLGEHRVLWTAEGVHAVHEGVEEDTE